MATVVKDISPADLLGRFRGRIFSSRPGYPEVLLLKVRDAQGGAWWFSTFYAEFSPSDPDTFLGKTVVTAEVESSGDLTIGFSDGSRLEVNRYPPEPDDPDDHLETWSLISPEGLALNYGPGEHWSLTRADDPV